MSDLCDIDEDEFMPYIQDFSPLPAAHFQSQTLPLHFHDPFDTATYPEAYQDAHSLPVLSTFEPPSFDVTKASPACSVCGSSSGSLAILDPCTHPLCSGCLTSALNIVGEKDMECAVCKAKVNDFKLQKLCMPNEEFETQLPSQATKVLSDIPFGSVTEPLEYGLQEFINRAQASSTPIPGAKTSRQSSINMHRDESAVLRIDNVPWVRV
jgi:hypothetical protein